MDDDKVVDNDLILALEVRVDPFAQVFFGGASRFMSQSADINSPVAKSNGKKQSSKSRNNLERVDRF